MGSSELPDTKLCVSYFLPSTFVAAPHKNRTGAAQKSSSEPPASKGARDLAGKGRTLPWARHAARMSKSRLPKRPVLSWVQEPRLSGGQEVNFGRSLSRNLQHFGLPLAFTDWANTAQSRAKWHRLATKPPGATPERHQKISVWQ